MWSRSTVRPCSVVSLKKVLYGKCHNTRTVGKPRTKWEDVVWRDTSQVLEIRKWRKRAKTEKNGGVY